MKYLNLSKGFNPYNSDESNTIKHESFFFNGGEPHIKLDMESLGAEQVDVVVTSRLTSMNELILLMVANRALRESGVLGDSFLFIPYVPAARQDRIMVPGEPLTVRLITDMINSMKFDEVITFDNHSDVSTALIDNCTNLDNHKFVRKCFKLIDKDRLSNNSNARNNFLRFVSPDAGAEKKIWGLVKNVNHNDPILCSKKRDIRNGEITGFKVNSSIPKGNCGTACIIVDDICDGGGTFIGLAKELKKKNAGDIYLIVSHGIFSKQLKELKPYFKKIYTTDSWRSEFGWERVERDATDLVEIVEFKDFM